LWSKGDATDIDEDSMSYRCKEFPGATKKAFLSCAMQPHDREFGLRVTEMSGGTDRVVLADNLGLKAETFRCRGVTPMSCPSWVMESRPWEREAASLAG
jgi:hypothetical protein